MPRRNRIYKVLDVYTVTRDEQNQPRPLQRSVERQVTWLGPDTIGLAGEAENYTCVGVLGGFTGFYIFRRARVFTQGVYEVALLGGQWQELADKAQYLPDTPRRERLPVVRPIQQTAEDKLEEVLSFLENVTHRLPSIEMRMRAEQLLAKHGRGRK